ncbi:condensation domain-containing protein [Sphaerisporangium corydalis]|uniref:condensation domain-containing protein n=1 Tax=Sphaerisporangium corydalis TaxID=1441875 RepID=UPI0021D0289F|nr:condensation domain-containing protein [Sphaerisporangium corydalis]
MLEPAELRAFVAGVLPDYMVPSAVVVLDELPLLPNGKLDRKALPVPDFAAVAKGRAPEGEAERVLADAYAEVLGLPETGADADFFTLGGDSIVAMRLVSRVRAAGLRVTPRQVFQHRTVAALASAAVPVNPATGGGEDASQGSGPVPLTPIMHALRELGGPIRDYHQAALVRTPGALTEPGLRSILRALVDRHPMLRSRLERTHSPAPVPGGRPPVPGGRPPVPGGRPPVPGGRPGELWSLRVADAGAADVDSWVARADVSGLGDAELRAAITEHAHIAQAALDPDTGDMMRAVWFDAGPGVPGRLLLLIHHLAVDGVSWRVLLPDLAAAWQDVVAGRPVSPAPVDVSFRRWSELLRERAIDPAVEDELPLWTSILSGDVPFPAARALDPERDVAATARHVSLTLPPGRTEPLLGRVPAAFRATVNDVLLTALSLAVATWRRRTPAPAHPAGPGQGNAVLVDLEGHGREEALAGDADLSRTVGWFTSVVPVRLDPGAGDLAGALAGGPALDQAVARIKEQLAALPASGIGHGMLRHLNPVTGPELAKLGDPPIEFNYLGRFGRPEATDWSYAPEDDAADLDGDPGMRLSHALTVNAMTEDHPGGPELVAHWSFASGLLSEDAVRDLAATWFQVLEALVDRAAALEASR